MAYRQDPIDQELDALLRLSRGFLGKRVLEVGCGNGRLTRKYASQAAWVDALDPNETKINRARELASEDETHVHYHAAALEEFQAAQSYEVVILSWSL